MARASGELLTLVKAALVFGGDENPVSVLLKDADGVPMLKELNNNPDIESVLVTSGPHQNIWFAPISINT